MSDPERLDDDSADDGIEVHANDPEGAGKPLGIGGYPPVVELTPRDKKRIAKAVGKAARRPIEPTTAVFEGRVTTILL